MYEEMRRLRDRRKCPETGSGVACNHRENILRAKRTRAAPILSHGKKNPEARVRPIRLTTNISDNRANDRGEATRGTMEKSVVKPPNPNARRFIAKVSPKQRKFDRSAGRERWKKVKIAIKPDEHSWRRSRLAVEDAVPAHLEKEVVPSKVNNAVFRSHGYNSIFRITHIAGHCTGKPLFLVPLRAPVAQRHPWMEQGEGNLLPGGGGGGGIRTGQNRVPAARARDKRVTSGPFTQNAFPIAKRSDLRVINDRDEATSKIPAVFRWKCFETFN
ncbi:hypothetical protein KM043_016744 [Ampulex compressa]|nr:hypothetical protein KM043_016744 [Ampulex compressa]